MVNRELIEVFSEIAREKNVERSELGSIIESLFLHLVERERGDASNCSVIVNLDKGEFEIYVEKDIVEDVEDPVMEITLEEIAKVDSDMAKDLEVGDSYIEIIDPMIFGRRMIYMAKQFFSQKLLDVEKKYIYEDYANRVGEIIIGTVHQVQRDNAFVNIDQAELRMPKKEQIRSERYRRGDTVRAVIKSVEITSRGPDIVVSRSDNHFLYKMFEMEVPEIEDGVIEITSIARYPGERAKIIVKSHDRRIDPVGACVGMRGSRIQAIVRELNNEKIDIINSSEQSEVLISRALSPAKPLDLYIDDDMKYCIAIFDDDELEFAFELNVKSMFHAIQAVLPAMRKKGEGSIINIASVCSSILGAPNRCVYGTTKAAIIGLTKSVAIEYITEGIRCNCICPGTVDSPSLHDRLRATGNYEKAMKDFVARQRMGRIGKADEIAAMALYLASDDSQFTTGQAQIVDGGWALG